LKGQKITLFILGFFFSFYAMGQQPTSSEVVNAVMPKGATKLTGEQLSNYVCKNYIRPGIPLDKENTYQLDGLLISFWDLSVKPEFKKSLQDSQSEILAILKRNDENVINYSKIIAVNNIQFLVYEYQKSDEVYLWFRSDFNKNNENIIGTIQFKKPDEDKAQKALQTFLQTVHFKE
jgi:hypothetical protein